MSIGVDSWAVDYGLLDKGGTLIEEPYHYRNARTEGAANRVFELFSPRELYEINGLQYLPFNTIFQLEAARKTAVIQRAHSLLLLPDLIVYWLCGQARCEATNASTTGLRDITTGTWSLAAMTAIDVREDLFASMAEPGTVLGTISPGVAAKTGLDPQVVVTLVGSHDTASAIVGIPARSSTFAYIVCGTWGLVGLELPKPCAY